MTTHTSTPFPWKTYSLRPTAYGLPLKTWALVACLGFGFQVESVRAAVSINTWGFGDFTATDGITPIPTNALWLLVADTAANGFGTVTAGGALNFVGATPTTSSDDIVIQLGGVDVTDGPGIINLGASLINVNLNTAPRPNWSAGDPLALYWFPIYTLLTGSASAGDPYGMYRTDTPVNGQDAWVTPVNGGSVNLDPLFTISAGGAQLDSLGAASFTVTAIPEPSSGQFLILGAAVLLPILQWRRKRGTLQPCGEMRARDHREGSMKNRLLPKILALVACLNGGFQVGLAQEVVTSPTGYSSVTLKGSSDNYFSVPFRGDVADQRRVSAVTPATLANSNANWAVNQWRYNTATGLTYYAQIGNGALEGVYYTILSNDTTRLYLDTEGDDLTAHPLGSVTNGTVFSVVPYWRIRDAFIGTNGGTFLEATPRVPLFKDSVLVFPFNTIGANKSASAAYYYLNTNGWRQQSVNNLYAGDVILPPGSCVMVRRRNSQDLNVNLFGSVLMQRSVVFLRSGTNTTANEERVSLSYPMRVSLNNSGLASNGGFRASASELDPQDRLLVFQPGSGFNPSPSATYYYLTNATQIGWRKVGSPETVDFGTNTFLEPGQGYIVRKAPAASDADWLQPPNF